MFSIILGCLTRYEETLEKAKENCRQFCRVLGKNNKNTIDALCNIGTINTWLGNDDEALAIYKKCYSLNCKVLGKDRPDTKTLELYMESTLFS